MACRSTWCQMEKKVLVRGSFVLFVSIFFLGCQQAPLPGNKVETETTASTTATPPLAKTTGESDPEHVVRELENAQAQFKRDRNGSIVEVDLRKTGSTEQLASLIAQLPRVRSLLTGETPDASKSLAILGSIQTLRHLDLRKSLVNGAALQHLASLKELRALRLSGKNNSSLDGGGLEAILKLTNLRALALDFLWVGSQELSQLQSLSNLEELYLAGTLVDDEALQILAQFPHLKKLRIAQTQVGDAGLAYLRQSSQLEELDLSENANITDAGLVNLSSITGLTRLNLWRLAISDAGVSHLAPLVNLRWLNLDNTGLTDKGLAYLTGMQKLQFLHLGSTSVTDAGLIHLENLSQLNELKVTRTAVTATGITALREKLPQMTVQLEYLE